MKSIKIKACPNCGGTDLEIKRYVKVNPTHYWETQGGDDDPEPEVWCPDCEDHPSYESLEIITYIPTKMVQFTLWEVSKKVIDLKNLMNEESRAEDEADLAEIETKINDLLKAIQDAKEN